MDTYFSHTRTVGQNPAVYSIIIYDIHNCHALNARLLYVFVFSISIPGFVESPDFWSIKRECTRWSPASDSSACVICPREKPTVPTAFKRCLFSFLGFFSSEHVAANLMMCVSKKCTKQTIRPVPKIKRIAAIIEGFCNNDQTFPTSKGFAADSPWTLKKVWVDYMSLCRVNE